MPTQIMHPTLSQLVPLEFIPNELEDLQEALASVFDDVFVKNLIFYVSRNGDTGNFSLTLTSYGGAGSSNLGIDIPLAQDLRLVLNPTDEQATEIPVRFDFRWPILRYIRNFDFNSFDSSAQSVLKVLMLLANTNEKELLLKFVSTLYPGATALDDFISEYNAEYGSSLPVPSNPNQPLSEKVDHIGDQIFNEGRAISEVVLDLISGNPDIDDLSGVRSLFESLFDDVEAGFNDAIKLNFGLYIDEISLGLQFPRQWLIPVYTGSEPVTGLVEDDPLPEPYHSILKFEVGSASYNSEQGFQFTEASAFSLNKSQIGKTGLIVSFEGLKVDLSRDTNIVEADADGRPVSFMGMYAEYAEVALPKKWFNNADNTSLQITARNFLVGSGGVSGTIALETIGGAPASENDYLPLNIGNWELEFNKFSMTFQQNVITESEIKGLVKIPKLKNGAGNQAEIEMRGHLNEEGDFNLAFSEPEGIPFSILELVNINIHTAELGRENDQFYLGTSCEIWFDNPIMNKLLDGQKIKVPNIRIYDSGKFEIVGGNSIVPLSFTLNLGPVEVGITAIHFGSHQRNGRQYNYWGFDGAISLDPLGLDARGEGVKYYYTVDNEDMAAEYNANNPNEEPKTAENFEDSFISIQTIEINLVIPGTASPDNAKAIINGILSVPEPGISEEYKGGITLKVPSVKFAAGAAMRLQPRYPAFLVDAFAEFEKPIPLGPIGIYGFRALMGYRYVAEKEAIGLVSGEDTWYDYFTYPARGINVDKFSGPEQSAQYSAPFSLGAGVLMGTAGDGGKVFSLKAMLLLSLPSVIVIEGRANVLSERLSLDSSDDPPFFAFIILSSYALEAGIGMDLRLPKAGFLEGKVIDLYAETQALFSFNDPNYWYINFGTAETPVSAVVFELFNVQAYLVISASGIEGAANWNFELKKQFGPAKVHVKAYAEKGGFISFQRPQIGGHVALGGAIKAKLWFISVNISANVLLAAEAPEPFRIFAEIKLKVCAKILFAKVCAKFTVKLEWIENDTVDRTPIAPLPFSETAGEVDRTLESVYGTHMLTSESYPVNFLNVTENQQGTWSPNEQDIDKIIPLDTFIDIKITKGVYPEMVSNEIGGYFVPPEKAKDLIPPEKIVKGGMELRQVKHKYEMVEFELKAWKEGGDGTAGAWVDYHPYKAVVKDEDPIELENLRTQVANYKLGYWQLTSYQYNRIRLLANNPFSYVEGGEPGWFIPEQFGLTPSTLFCEGQQNALKCFDVLNKTLGTTYYPSLQEGVSVQVNNLFFTIQGEQVLEINETEDGIQETTASEVEFEVTDASNPFGFNRSLEFSSKHTLVITLPEPTVQLKMKITTASSTVTFRVYKSLIDDTSSAVQYELVEEFSRTSAQLESELNYDNVNEPFTKIEIEPSTANLDVVTSLQEQIQALIDQTYENASGIITGPIPDDQVTYNQLNNQLDSELSRGCGPKDARKGGDRETDCITSIQEICWLGLEAYEYNESIPGQDALNAEQQLMSEAIQNVVQPIWRPNTKYYIHFKLKDAVDNGENEKTFDYYYGFRTVETLGHYHLNSNVDYVPEGENPSAYPLTALRKYINYNKSYPNADGSLLMAKPVFYGNEQCKITLFFTKPITYHLLNKWHSYNGLPNIEAKMHIAIKDPITDQIIPYPLPVDYEEITVPVPIEDDAWVNESDESLVPNSPTATLDMELVNSLIEDGNNNGATCQLQIGEPLIPNSFAYQVTLANLFPSKLYTAQVYSGFDKDGDGVITGENSELIHEYTFQTSRFRNFKEQVNSYILQEIADDGTILNTQPAVFGILRENITLAIVQSAFSVVDGSPDAYAENLEGEYLHPFDRVIEGIFRIEPIDPPMTTEINLIKAFYGSEEQIIGILIKNPEPFNNPKMPLSEVADTIEIVSGSGNSDESFKYLHSKDYSQVLIMKSNLEINQTTVNIKFTHKIWNGSQYIIGNQIDSGGNPLNVITISGLQINN